MKITTSLNGDILVCSIDGEIDINTSPQVKKAFDKLVKDKQKKIVINLGRVSYIDSSGLATLVEALKNLRNYGGRLKLTDLSSKVKSLFEITKLEKLFDIADTAEEALKAFL